jgi:hypothetical protein
MTVTFDPFTIIPAFCYLDYVLGIPDAISQAVTGDVSTRTFKVYTLD